ncbi:hypothetical protein VNO78_12616 [Psophocarpus tetragonolobus]|uniref:Uncharacterized protein n=1 Tax=Psophocarpus tetragonolobus TaxID=3891 RepID=A0AAN9SNA2_PSOTE
MPDILRFIIVRKGEWFRLRDNEGRTALHYAASIGYLNAVMDLLGCCISSDMERDKDGLFPLHLASASGHVEVVKKLLQYCPDPRELLDNNGQNFVHTAAKVGMLNVARYICKRKIMSL